MIDGDCIYAAIIYENPQYDTPLRLCNHGKRTDLRVRVRLAGTGRRRCGAARRVVAATAAAQLVQQQRIEPARCGVMRLVLQNQAAVF